MEYRAKQLGYKIKSHKRKYNFNENYFDNIDTDTKAYFLGFIMADGCIIKTRPTSKLPNRLVINISSKDRIILEELKKELQTTCDIIDYYPNGHTYANNQMSKLVINSQHLCTSLVKLNVTERKTGHEAIPKINEKYIPSFIRGFFDGDGTGTMGNIGFYSSKCMIQDLKKIFVSWGMTGALTIKKDKRHENIYTLHIFKKEDKKIYCDKVYTNDCFCLKRKYDKIIR